MFLDLALRHAELLAEHKGLAAPQTLQQIDVLRQGTPRRRARPGRTTFGPTGRPASDRSWPRLPLQHFAARHPPTT
jgi:hypothetical protein